MAVMVFYGRILWVFLWFSFFAEMTTRNAEFEVVKIKKFKQKELSQIFSQKVYSIEGKTHVACQMCKANSPHRFIPLYNSGNLSSLYNHLNFHKKKNVTKLDSGSNRVDFDPNKLSLDSSGTVNPPLFFPSEEATDSPFGCEYISVGRNLVEFEELAPDPELIEHYGAMIAAAAKGLSIRAIIQIFHFLPSKKKIPCPIRKKLAALDCYVFASV